MADASGRGCRLCKIGEATFEPESKDALTLGFSLQMVWESAAASENQRTDSRLHDAGVPY